MSMRAIKKEKNLEKNIYSDEASIIIDEIVSARENNSISNDEMKMLIKLVLQREIKQKTQSYLESSIKVHNRAGETRTFFMNWNNRIVQHG